ncbi:MAG TPA: ABC transporter permease [Vicinamibacterales bacterium]|nr:ABC transporter permease [Vicinamibacterales bacterium]
MPTFRERLTRLRGSLGRPRNDLPLEPEARHAASTADARGPWLENLRRDLRHAWRTIVRNPAFAIVATTTLAAGIALCLTVLAVVNAYLIRPLPYPDADRLYSVVLGTPGQDQPRGLSDIDWTHLDDLVEHRIAWDLDMFYLLGGAYPEAAPGAWVTPGFVSGLGLRAARGRVLETGDFTTAGAPAVMISHRLWMRRFGGDPNIVGRTLRAFVSDRPDEPETLTVVGVLPPEFWHVNSYTDVVGPLRAPAYPYLVTLRHGVGAGYAAERASSLVRMATPGLPEDWRAMLVPFQARYAEEMRPLLNAVALAAALVLLIACANVAVLLLVRSARRRQELAIRLALGASRRRVARLLSFEGLLLGGASTALGLAISSLLTQGLGQIIEQRLGRRLPGGESALAIDGTLLAAALAGVLVLTAVLTLAPLATLWSTAMTPALKSGGRGATEGRGARRLRSVLIAGEIAAALALLVGSALMIRSSIGMLTADPGFRADGVWTTSIGLRQRAYPDAASRAGLYARLLQQLEPRASGGRAALSAAWPLQPVLPIHVETATVHPATADAAVIRVSAAYFHTLEIPFRDGGTFESQDRIGGEPVVVISESLARRLWPDARAVGQLLRIPVSEDANLTTATPHRVVGVVQDVRQIDYDDGQVRSDGNQLDAYVPLLQDPGRFAFVYVQNPGETPDGLRTLVAAIDPEIAAGTPQRLASALEESRSGPRQLAWLLTAFAAFAGLLALVGVYSVIAYGVRQREREIGVRLVVGADPGAVIALFLREGGALLAAGLAAGVAGAVVVGQLLRSQLFGVQPVEPGVLIAVTAAFAVCGSLACWWPARRAAMVDPARVLRDE